MIEKISGQSYKWPSFGFEFQQVDKQALRAVRLLERRSGNYTEYVVRPGGDFHGVAIRHSGTVTESKASAGDVVIALVSSGSWSGGSNYHGYIFGTAGAVVFFACKGNHAWLVFDDNGYQYQDIRPGTEAKEL